MPKAVWAHYHSLKPEGNNESTPNFKINFDKQQNNDFCALTEVFCFIKEETLNKKTHWFV